MDVAARFENGGSVFRWKKLEVHPQRELEPPHIRSGRQSGDLARGRVRNRRVG